MEKRNEMFGSFTDPFNCVKDTNGKVLVESDQVREVWWKYMEKLLN